MESILNVVWHIFFDWVLRIFGALLIVFILWVVIIFNPDKESDSE